MSVISNLLAQALSIEKDLLDRLSRQPGNQSMLRELVEYEELIEQFTGNIESHFEVPIRNPGSFER